ncbi:MAG: CDP-alcohol phosphatidyltransferase family protein [Acidimicrobiales bacterium]|nr:CDP-alcohol phosphatidyltransferase family protein [Actinomycetota bacterium]
MKALGFGPTALATPANAITLTRVLATPFLLALIFADGLEWAALALWIVLAVTDGADGWIARRHGTTRSGAFLDPLADKIVVLSAMAALVSEDRMWWVPVAVIALRELAVSAYRSYVARQGVSVPARSLAKIKTVFQDVAVGLALVPATGTAYRGLVGAVLWTSVALTVVTGTQYLWDGRRIIRAV